MGEAPCEIMDATGKDRTTDLPYESREIHQHTTELQHETTLIQKLGHLPGMAFTTAETTV